MVKYMKEDSQIVFSEIPDEITLAINITNCPHKCDGCHSPYLQKDIGEELTTDVIDDLISKNKGITCVCFMGEGNDLYEIFRLGIYIKNVYGFKLGIYCGSNDLPLRFWNNFNYIKLGEYKKELGGLDKQTTNQRLYKYDSYEKHPGWRDITQKFWKKI